MSGRMGKPEVTSPEGLTIRFAMHAFVSLWASIEKQKYYLYPLDPWRGIVLSGA